MTSLDAEITVVAHMRVPTLLNSMDSHIKTLRTCESDGLIDRVLLRSWPERIMLTGENPHQEVIDAFERFTLWADWQNVRIQPPFKVRTTTSLVTEKTREVLITPLFCLAIYRGDQLLSVFPYSTDEKTHTVPDAIATLCSGDLPTPPEVPVVLKPRNTCPECNGTLLKKQAIFACSDCSWTGAITSNSQYLPSFLKEERNYQQNDDRQTVSDSSMDVK